MNRVPQPDAMLKFPIVCAALQYAAHINVPPPPAWVRARDQLYNMLIMDLNLNFKLPAAVLWDALEPDEQEYAQESYHQLRAAEESWLVLDGATPSGQITPWWSAFFFSS